MWRNSKLLYGLSIALISSIMPTTAIPTMNYPINAQYPPVARINRPYQFTFSDSTFATTGAHIQYTLSNAPAWLQLDSGGRILKGQPTEQDAGVVTFDLVATDETGPAILTTSLTVSKDDGPGLGKPVADQLSSIGTFSGPDGLLFYPSSPISISFTPDTFTHTDDNTMYYATCANSTPLPSWIHFEPEHLTFTGNALGLISPQQLPQDFGIRLIASDVPGFSAAVAIFHIIIESHELTFGNSSFELQVQPGEEVTFDGLSTLTLDNTAALGQNVTISSKGMPSWLSIDPSSFKIHGNAPPDVQDSEFDVRAEDSYHNTANATVALLVGSPLHDIIEPVASLNATTGEYFEYQFKKYRSPDNGIKLSLDLSNASSFLSFDPDTLVLSGDIPADLNTQSIPLNLTATSGTSLQQKIIILTINVSDETAQSSALAVSTATSRVSVADPSTTPSTQASRGDRSTPRTDASKIVAGVLAPVFFVTLTLCLILCLRRKQFLHRPTSDAEKESGPCTTCIRKLKLDKHWISKPIIHEDKHAPWHDNEKLLNLPKTPISAAPFIADIAGGTRPTTASNPPRFRHSQRPLTSHSRRSSFLEGLKQEITVLNQEIAKRASWLRSVRSQTSPKHVHSISEEKVIGNSKRASCGRSKSQARVSSIHQARADRLRRSAHLVNTLSVSRRPSGIGHGTFPTHPARSSAMLMSRSISQAGLGHGRRSSSYYPPGSHEPRSSAEWTTTGTSISASATQTAPGSIVSEACAASRTAESETASTVPRSPSQPVIPQRSLNRPISATAAKALAEKGSPSPDLERELYLSRIVRESKEGRATLFAKRASNRRHIGSHYPLTQQPVELSATVSTEILAGQLWTSSDDGSGLGLGPGSSIRARNRLSWRQDVSAARGRGGRQNGFLIRNGNSASSLQSRRRQSQVRRSSSGKYKSGYGRPPQLARFPSVSMIGGTNIENESQNTSKSGIELIEELTGEENGERKWKEKGKRVYESFGYNGESIENERGASEVLREIQPKRPVSVMEKEGAEAEGAKKSLRGTKGMVERNSPKREALESAFL